MHTYKSLFLYIPFAFILSYKTTPSGGGFCFFTLFVTEENQAAANSLPAHAAWRICTRSLQNYRSR